MSHFLALSVLYVWPTCLMICPTYSITISSAAIGSIANRPHSWMWLLLKRILFLRNWNKKTWTVILNPVPQLTFSFIPLSWPFTPTLSYALHCSPPPLTHVRSSSLCLPNLHPAWHPFEIFLSLTASFDSFLSLAPVTYCTVLSRLSMRSVLVQWDSGLICCIL